MGMVVVGVGTQLGACDNENTDPEPSDGNDATVQPGTVMCTATEVAFAVSFETDCVAASFYVFEFDEDALARTMTEVAVPSSTAVDDRRYSNVTVPRGTRHVSAVIYCTEGRGAEIILNVPACPNVDGGLEDGSVDAGVDGGSTDAGAMDAASEDAGTDAGVADATLADASSVDAGPALLGFAYLPTIPSSGVGDGAVMQFRALADGTLLAMTPTSLPVGERANRVAVATIGALRFLYVSNSGSDTVSQFAVGADGALSALSPATVATGAEPDAMLVAGSNLYVVNSRANSVSRFAIGVDGVLAAPATSVATGTGDVGTVPVGICALGDHVYVANAGTMEGISVYTRDGTGALTRHSDVAARSGGYTALACAADGEHLYAAGPDVIFQFARSADSLSASSPESVASDIGVTAMFGNSDSSKLFSLSLLDQAVGFFSASSGGLLSAMTPAGAVVGDLPEGAAFDPTERYFYVVGPSAGVLAYDVSALASTPTVSASGVTGQSITLIAP